VRLLRVPGPSGKAAALNRAVPEARGEVLVLGDTRQSFAVDAVRKLLRNLAEPGVGAVSGELFIDESGTGGSTRGVGAYWRYEKAIRRAESAFDSTVGVTGAIYALRKELYRPLDPRTIIDDVAIPMEAVLQGYRVVFEPAAHAFDRASPDDAREYRRKVRTLSGNYQLVFLRPALLNPLRNRLFFQLVSHKLMRLAVPWLLLLLLLSSLLLAALGAGLFYLGALLAQLAFYLLALLGRIAGARTPLLGVPYSFVLLNLAAAAALFGFLLGTERASWRDERHRPAVGG
jgi:cellulose synthase/poly-beta-1,6-N-acetylglucosamine synthase-like glycosyltransferase